MGEFLQILNSRIRKIRENTTLEPILFIFMVGITLPAVIAQNLYIQQICKISLEYDKEICSNLTNYSDQEKKVESQASYYTLYKSILESGPAFLIVLFIGSYLDLGGSSKKPILLCISGFAFYSTILLILSFFSEINPGILLISSVPVAFTGGIAALLLATFNYITLCTSEENRSFRIAILEFTWFLGSPIGLAFGSEFFKVGGFKLVFTLSAIVLALSVALGALTVKEPSSTKPEVEISFRKIANISTLTQSIKSTFIKRPERKWIIVILIIIYLRLVALIGVNNVVYLFTRNKYGWTQSKFSKFVVIDAILSISGGYFVIFLFIKKLKISDTLIGIFSACGLVLSNFIVAISTSSWQIYLALSIQMFSGLIVVVARSQISKIVPKTEIGRVFSFIALGETLIPFSASPLFNLLYSSTLNVYPGAVFLLASGINLLIVFAYLYLHISLKRSQMNQFKHSKLTEEHDNDMPNNRNRTFDRGSSGGVIWTQQSDSDDLYLEPIDL